MCLAVPGLVVALDPAGPGLPTGRVDFAGVTREVCLACTPEVQVGNYVLVHAGLALSVLDEQEAQSTFEYLKQLWEPEASETEP
ncbi:HypC/HybG/HupF family hydrogenase formation chaperone [Myxococcota bacterium]